MKPLLVLKIFLLNKKIKTYLLLGLVLVIWGILAYRVTLSINPKIPEVKTQNTVTKFKPQNSLGLDTFSIQTTKRDPFLGVLSAVGKPKKATLKPPKNITWPKIRYDGMVKKEQPLSEIFVVSINTNQYLLKRGQIADSITLVSGTPKSITIKYKGILKIIKTN